MIYVLMILALLVLVPLSLVWSGYVLTCLWDWFIRSTFETMPALSIPAAIGLIIIVAYLTHQTDMNDKSDVTTSSYWINLSIAMFVIPLYFLGIGWAVRQFM